MKLRDIVGKYRFIQFSDRMLHGIFEVFYDKEDDAIVVYFLEEDYYFPADQEIEVNEDNIFYILPEGGDPKYSKYEVEGIN